LEQIHAFGPSILLVDYSRLIRAYTHP